MSMNSERTNEGERVSREGFELGDQEHVANRRDTSAANAQGISGAEIAALRPFLTNVARRFESVGLSAEDLVSTAVLRLYQSLEKGSGQVDNLAAYLVTSMRNAAIDFNRSRKSSEVTMGDFFEGESPFDVEDRTTTARERIDRHREYALVHQALRQLPAQQQRVLIDTAVHEMKPAELAQSYGVSAGTLAVRANRARSALKIALRRVILAETAHTECQPYIEDLAKYDAPSTRAASAHRESCEYCEGALERFRAMPSLLALVPGAILTGLVVEALAPATAAAAASGAAVSAHGGAAGSVAREGASQGARIAVTAGAAVVAVGVVIAGVFAFSNTSAPSDEVFVAASSRDRSPTLAPELEAPTPSPSPTSTRDTSSTSPAGIETQSTPEPPAATLETVEISVPATPAVEASPFLAPPEALITFDPDVPLAVESTISVDGPALELAIQFENAEGITVDQIEFTLDPDVIVREVSGGWSCSFTQGDGTCSRTSPVNQPFVLQAQTRSGEVASAAFSAIVHVTDAGESKQFSLSSQGIR
ncbi:sigma-70 family RNA polymerase sigma factor [Humidisolicoccus flavus]|uniref:sigma-70 family RNA polymerase sigma factor n=1 Tax=Humidisolicoccus flavus TaxID=3111414 RepID=UPI003243695D